MSLASWYHQQYSSWNRTRRIQQAPYLARTDTNASRAATAMAQNGQTTIVANMAASNEADAAANNNANGNQKKTQDPLFGPNIGAVTMGPPWTITSEKKMMSDDLTPEIVSGWVEKSKEPSHPTTTLQALVNLKRPSLRLSPLTSVPEDPSSSDQHHHGLEFEYDCDAPKCGIYVYVFLSRDHPDAPSTNYPMAKLLVFETVTDGGFGKMLKLEEGALLELGRWEHVLGRKASERASGSTSPLPPAIPEEASPSASADGGLASQAGRNQHQHNRRRFTHFHFRKRSQNRSVSGPALTVVDAEPQQQQQQDKKDAAKDEAEEGVRVTIRLAALDEQGSELASPNEQVTYLHVVRYGPRPEGGAEDEEDTRPWVVKVVKREATIGPHTFHLHEIYGLTSSTTNNYAPTSALPAVTNSHTYPPDPNALDTQEAAVAPGDEDDPQSECLLCLSAAREVVLLPCRHLVACKDCALNMVEFGAGGNITQAPEPSTGSGAGDAEGGEGGEVGAAVAAGGPAVPAPTITTTTNPRRKRKAKGWFCPVCRQPYTSLLRITTTPPPPASHKQEGGSGPEDGDPSSSTAGTGNATTETGGGILGGMLRPGFLRGLSSFRTGTQPPPAPPAIDVESQAGLGGRGS